MTQNTKQQPPVDLRKLMQEKNDAAAKKFEEILNTELFPIERLTESWKRNARKALMKSAPINHRLNLIQFSNVVGCNEYDQLTLFQFGVLSNSLETVSPDALQLGEGSYCELMKEALDHILWYQDRIKELREQVQLEIDKEFSMKEAAAAKNGGLKPVIGQA
jgi:hypothetical protein